MGIFDIFTKKGYSKWRQKQIDTFKQNIAQTKNVFNEQKQQVNDYKQQLKEIKNELSLCFEEEHISDKLNLSTYDRQLEETIEIIKTSKNPDTVISRFDFLEDLYSRMFKAANSISNWDEINTCIQELIKNKNKYVNESIKRNLEAELIKINQLKTEKGKINRLNRFFEFVKTIPNLTDENFTYIDELKNKTLEIFEN